MFLNGFDVPAIFEMNNYEFEECENEIYLINHDIKQKVVTFHETSRDLSR